MTYLTVCAHDVTDDFEKQILEDHQVTIKDRAGEPWSVVFEGDRAALIDMFNQNWTNGDVDERLLESSPWLTEVYVEAEKNAAVAALASVSESRGGAHGSSGLIVDQGEFIGRVVQSQGEVGVVIQKVGRDPDMIARHDVAKLSRVPDVGEVVDIKYQGGLGQVSDRAVDIDKDKGR